MEFHGSVTFAIADEKNIDVDFGADIILTKTVKKGDVIFRGGGKHLKTNVSTK